MFSPLLINSKQFIALNKYAKSKGGGGYLQTSKPTMKNETDLEAV